MSSSLLEVLYFVSRDGVGRVWARESSSHWAAGAVWPWCCPRYFPAEVAVTVDVLTFCAQWRALVGIPVFVPDSPTRQAGAAPLSCDEATVYAGSGEGDVSVTESEEFQRGQRHLCRAHVQLVFEPSAIYWSYSMFTRAISRVRLHGAGLLSVSFSFIEKGILARE